MDPLSSFTSLIRTLWRDRVAGSSPRAVAVGEQATQGRSADVVLATAGRDEDLRERLRARLAPLKTATSTRRCEAFVETVLLFELSDRIGTDPRFSELVTRVAQELSAEPRVGARLDELLTELTASPAP